MIDLSIRATIGMDFLYTQTDVPMTLFARIDVLIGRFGSFIDQDLNKAQTPIHPSA